MYLGCKPLELASISRSGFEFVGNWLISSPPLTSLNMFHRWRNLYDFHKQIDLTPFGMTGGGGYFYPLFGLNFPAVYVLDVQN